MLQKYVSFKINAQYDRKPNSSYTAIWWKALKQSCTALQTLVYLLVSLSCCTWMRLLTFNCRSSLIILLTADLLIPVSLEISRGFLRSPALFYWLKMRSCTMCKLFNVLTVLGRPLPGWRIILPVASIFCMSLVRLLSLQGFPGNSFIIFREPQ
jgi:hypothetical protein